MLVTEVWWVLGVNCIQLARSEFNRTVGADNACAGAIFSASSIQLHQRKPV